jgi:biotin carboxyl carrier protein
MDWNVQIGSKLHKVSLPDGIPNNSEFDVKLNGRNVKARWIKETKTLLFLETSKGENVWASINTRYKSVTSFPQESDILVNLEFIASQSKHASTLEATVSADIPGKNSHEHAGGTKKPKVVRSQITGKVLNVLVKEGDNVSVGDTLMIIEAMKMENRIISTYAGKVEKIAVGSGAMVSNGAELIRIK